jgi:cyclopropane fatty-acyl-phospholipid synthase-like methyltransferase
MRHVVTGKTPIISSPHQEDAMPDSDGFAALDFYTRFYDALPRSRAYSEFCRRLYGADMGQHGFSDMAQIDALLDAARVRHGEAALDIGCGDGRIAEYVSERTGAHVAGLELSPVAVAAAHARSARKRDRLQFMAGDIARLESYFPPRSFDVIIAIDALYFTDLADTIRQMQALLRPGGRLTIFYSHAADPWHPVATFPKETLPADAGPLAAALRANGLSYRWWDFTDADYEHARRKKAVIEALRPAYETAEDEFLCECRMGEALGVIEAHEGRAHARHLFIADA